MSRLMTIGVLITGMLISAGCAAEAAVHAKHIHSRRFIPPNVGVPWDVDNGFHANPGVGGTYGAGPVGTGEMLKWDSGGVNSMSNDFGTSGTLGHTNGMPAGTYIYGR
jgi:hypothetical protein